VESRVEREPGTVQRFADRAGGPTLFMGANYQSGVVCAEVLRLVAWQQRSPMAVLHAVVEGRALVGGGQYGFDLRVVTPEEDVLIEVKASPLPEEIRELLARLGKLPAGPRVRLVHGKATKWTTALDRLVRYAGEATDDAGLRALVEASGDDDLASLFGDVASDSAELLARMDAPEFLAPSSLARGVETASRLLAGDQGPDLVRRVLALAAVGAEDRADIRVGELLDGLVDDGVVARLDVAGPLGDGRLAVAVAVLDRCPAPLPESVLAAALGLPAGGAAEVLDGLIAAGMVLHDNDGRLWRPRGGARLSGEGADLALRAALEGLLAIPAARHGERVAQVPNVLSLSHALVGSSPGVVAGGFKSYDKAVKATGDLSAVHRLASLALDAATRDTGLPAKEVLDLRGHARICGTAWVLQRVDMPAEAARQMVLARLESAEAGSRDNLAFADKCQGRLSRLTAEDLDAAGESTAAAAAYAASRMQLDAGYSAFTELLRAPEFARLDEEPGECLALRARTELSAGRLDEAERYAALAHVELDHLTDQRKACADVCLVDAELVMARARDGMAPEEARARILATADGLQGVLDEFRPATADPATVDVGASEIVGRTLRVLGVLALEAGDDATAAVLFDQAAEQFERVDQARTAYRCRAAALELTGAVPAELLAALRAAGADDATTVEAHRLHALAPARGPAPARHWEALAERGRVEAAARVHEWTDRRAV
jgi:hypothetical protein